MMRATKFTCRQCSVCNAGSRLDDLEGCVKCDQDEVCPVGTTFAFKAANLDAEFERIQYESVPNVYENLNQTMDRTQTVTMLALMITLIVFFGIIGLCHVHCKEKSIFFFK